MTTLTVAQIEAIRNHVRANNTPHKEWNIIEAKNFAQCGDVRLWPDSRAKETVAFNENGEKVDI